MSEAWRKLIASTVICYLVAFGLSLLSAIFAFSLGSVLAMFQWQWIVARAWSDFFELMPVAQAWAVLITFALVIPTQSGSIRGTSFERFGTSIVAILVMALVFSLTYGIAHPRVVSRRENLETVSIVSRALWRIADDARQSQDHARELAALEQYIGLVGETDDAVQRRADARKEVRKDASRGLGDSGTAPPTHDGPATARELVARAQAARAVGDYSTSHYMATLAQSLEPDNDEAARLAAEALQRLQGTAPDEAESEAAVLFGMKQAAKESLTRGDVVDAYYRFAELRRRYPADRDVERYLATARERIENLGVFRDEVEPLLGLPGTGSFVFVNGEGEDWREVISIGKLIQVPAGLYAHQVEVIRFSLDGSLESHRSSAYGKLVANADGRYLVLTVLDREDPSAIIYPVDHHGVVAPETGGLVLLSPAADELWLLGVASADPTGAAVTDLFRTTRLLRTYGLVPEPAQAELLRRLSLPFTFLILNFFVLGFAWRYRSRHLSWPPLPTLVLVPLAPLFLVPVYLFLRFAHRVLFSALLLWTGLALSVVILVVVEAALLVISLMYLALSSRE